MIDDRKIPIRSPRGAKVSSDLYPEMGSDELTQNIAVVSLPNGITIEVGWFPEHDPAGSFRVEVCRGFGVYFEREGIKDAYDVAELVGELGDRFAGDGTTLAASEAADTVLC